MDKTTNEKLEIRKFGVGLTVLLCIIGGWQFYKGDHKIYLWFFGFGALVLILSFLAPTILKPLYKILTTIARAIGWVNTRIILFVIYYTIFTLIGMFLRLIHKDLLDRKINKDAETYWIKKDKDVFTKKQYERQF